MNEQLALIDKKTIPVRRHLVRKAEIATTSTHQTKDQWWKLSDEQRQQGLAGGRAGDHGVPAFIFPVGIAVGGDPGIAAGDIGLLAGCVGADLAAELDFLRQLVAPGLVVTLLEDAAVLASCLAQNPDNVLDALRHYANLRRPRVNRAVRTARQNGRIYHLGGPLAVARDLAMQALGGRRLLARQDWIYNWRN